MLAEDRGAGQKKGYLVDPNRPVLRHNPDQWQRLPDEALFTGAHMNEAMREYAKGISGYEYALLNQRFQDYLNQKGNALNGQTKYELPENFTPALLEAYMSGKPFAFTGINVKSESHHSGLRDNDLKHNRIFGVSPYMKSNDGEYYTTIYCNGVPVADCAFGTEKPVSSEIFIEVLGDPKYIIDDVLEEAFEFGKQLAPGVILGQITDYLLPGSSQLLDTPMIAGVIDAVTNAVMGPPDYRLAHDVELSTRYFDRFGRVHFGDIEWHLTNDAQEMRGNGLEPND